MPNMNISDPELVVPLTPHAFYVLLALAGYQNNAYGLIQAVKEDSDGIINLTAGTLYPLLKRLLAMDYIIEIGQHPASGPTGISKVYRLSGRGRIVLEWELDRYRQAVALGQERRSNRVQ
jgi:DNA-binding PadR family transcriptional regulator